MFEPIGDYIKIQPDLFGEKTPLGVAVPDHLQGKAKPYGKVVAVGPGTKEKQRFRVGDRVFVASKQNMMFEEDGVLYYYTNQHFVMAKEVDRVWEPEAYLIKVKPDPRTAVIDGRGDDFYYRGKIIGVSDESRKFGLRKNWRVDYDQGRILRVKDFNTGEVVDYLNFYDVKSAFNTGKKMIRGIV